MNKKPLFSQFTYSIGRRFRGRQEVVVIYYYQKEKRFANYYFTFNITKTDNPDDYIKLAKEEIKKEIKNGILKEYSEEYFGDKYMKPRVVGILAVFCGITLIVSTSLFVWKSCDYSPKHTISFAGDNYTVNGKVAENCFIKVGVNAKIGIIKNIKPADGYELPKKITINDFKSDEYTWNLEEGTIDFNDLVMPDHDLRITINPTVIAGNKEITFIGEDYEAYYKDRRVASISFKPGECIDSHIDIYTSNYYRLTDESFSIMPSSIEPSWQVDALNPAHGTITFGDIEMPKHDFMIYIEVFE